MPRSSRLYSGPSPPAIFTIWSIGLSNRPRGDGKFLHASPTERSNVGVTAPLRANRRNSASCDETGRITFSFFIHLSFAFSRRSPPLVLRFYDGSRPHEADPLRES